MSPHAMHKTLDCTSLWDTVSTLQSPPALRFWVSECVARLARLVRRLVAVVVACQPALPGLSTAEIWRGPSRTTNKASLR